MESVRLSQDQLDQIVKLFMDNSELLVAAHHSMLWSVYSTGNRDVSVIVDAVDNMVEHPDHIPGLMGGPETSVTLKTRDIEGYSKETYDVAAKCTEITNSPLVHYTSIHIFEADKGAVSFEDHTDPVDVIMLTVDGIKDIIITDDNGDEQRLSLGKGEYVYVPLGLVHRIENVHASTMLSIGLERFHLDHIQEEL